MSDIRALSMAPNARSVAFCAGVNPCSSEEMITRLHFEEFDRSIAQPLEQGKISRKTAHPVGLRELGEYAIPQQWWFFRLTFALGRLPSFPEAPFVSLWEDRHLPPPRSGYGMPGLLALQEYQQQRYGVPLNFLDDWQNQINHLLIQEEAYHRSLSGETREALLLLSA